MYRTVVRSYWSVPCSVHDGWCSNQTTVGKKNHINDIKQIFSFRSRKKGCRRGSEEAIFHIFIFHSFIWLAFPHWMPFVMGEMIEKWSSRLLFERFCSADVFPQLVNDYIRAKVNVEGKSLLKRAIFILSQASCVHSKALFCFDGRF